MPLRPIIFAERNALTPDTVRRIEAEGYMVIEHLCGGDVRVDWMTLRDHFAIGALTMLHIEEGGPLIPEAIAVLVYRIADAMLKVRLDGPDTSVPVG